MRFSYTYRSSDGQRHTDEIEAESRDAAITAIHRELGVKPIKVMVASVSTTPTVSEAKDSKGTATKGTWRYLMAGGIFAAVLVSGTWWLLKMARREAPPDVPYQATTPQGTVTYTVAQPLPRQTIPGDRVRIENACETTFQNSAERLLARFAEPGRPVPVLDGVKPTRAEFAVSLREPIRIASTDFTEVVDLKRIVTGLKREMRAYLAGGGTVEGYIAELEKRQRLEISYRENAHRRLREMLSKPKEAYDYWLKANAQLQAVGIFPLALPDALRAYQMSLGIDE